MSENGHENTIKSETIETLAQEAIETLAQVAEALNLTPDYVRTKVAFNPQWKSQMYKKCTREPGATPNDAYFFPAGTIAKCQKDFSRSRRRSDKDLKLQKENENLKAQLKALAGQFAIMKKTILDGGYWPPAAQSLTDLKIEEETC